MSKTLELQRALRGVFLASPEVAFLVGPGGILDTHKRPAPSPSVVLGEDLARPVPGNVKGDRIEVTHDLHIYVAEPSMEGAKSIMGALRRAIAAAPRSILRGYHLALLDVVAERAMRDPDGRTSHGVLTVRAQIGGAD